MLKQNIIFVQQSIYNMLVVLVAAGALIIGGILTQGSRTVLRRK